MAQPSVPETSPSDPDETSPSEPARGYRPGQRLALIVSMSLLAAIMTAIAFAAGVYIGNNRELAPAAALGGPGGQPRPGQQNQPLPGGQAIPGGNGQNAQPAQQPFDLAGPILAASAGSVSLPGPNGGQALAVDQGTRVGRPDGTVLRVTDLRPGMNVGIRLRPGAPSPTAETIVILGANPAQQPNPQQQQQPPGR